MTRLTVLHVNNQYWKWFCKFSPDNRGISFVKPGLDKFHDSQLYTITSPCQYRKKCGGVKDPDILMGMENGNNTEY